MAKAGQITENRDPKTEQWLKTLGIQFEFLSDISPGRINFDRSRRNQVRLGAATDEKTVAQYEADMQNGNLFPPTLLSQMSDGSYYVLGGLHRWEAAKRIGRGLDAYICTGSEVQLMRVAFEDNTHHGKQYTTEERVHHALFLVNTQGFSLMQAALLMKVKHSRLASARALQLANARATEAQIPPKVWDKLRYDTRKALAKIRTAEVLKVAAELAAAADMDRVVVTQFVKEINATSVITKQTAVVSAWRDSLQSAIADHGNTPQGKTGTRLTLPITRARMALGTVLSLDIDVKALEPAEQESLRTRLAEVRMWLDQKERELSE